ncbi:serine/arginine repetitive matrix protein 1-like [Teratosphaeria destructans]|uniref:Serine/arginine repetitive matrix protein 1-like n=1 Tax=Teratosphaeria destructans TaxID=418781 RepID=A0A9W7W258_9PEZI|nr:serine/arginine repetitive matrix protein 1-like [Teratosphaeria destructans]
MSRREYPVADRYDERESDFYRRPRRDRNYDDLDLDIDINRTRYPEDSRSRVSRAPKPETVVKERETVVDERRSERGPRQPDFLREDYGKTSAGPLVVREERTEIRDDDAYSRAPTRRRSRETVRSSRPPEKFEEEKITIREKGPPYPRSDRGEDDEIIFRERTRSRPPPPSRRGGSDEEIDIKIKRRDESRPPPPKSEAPPRSEVRSEVRERDVEEIRFRRGGGDRPEPPKPPRTEVDDVDIRIRETETRSPPPRSEYRGRNRVFEEEIDIRERSRPPPRERSISLKPQLVARDREEWIVRRKRDSPPPPPRDYEKEEIIIRRKERSSSPEPPPPPPPETYKKEEIIIRRKERSPSPEPPPPPRQYEREQIIIRRKERSPSPEPPREPTPPPPTPPPAPIIRPPIIQEVITHHRHIDHGVERARSPTPPPPPAPPSPPREEDLEIEIRRRGTRNGKYYDEDIIFEKNEVERKSRGDSQEVSRRRSVSATTRRRSPSPVRRLYEDDITAEAEYYNRKVRERAYPGEAWNGATKDWGLVDVPPGTERVRMDGVGGGRQEIYWDRYRGERRGKFSTGDRVYEQDYGLPEAPPPPPAIEAPPPAPAPPPREERSTEIKISERRITEETSRGKTKDKMWTEVTKDLVIKEAIDEMGYEYEETDEFFYIMEYLKYVSLFLSSAPRSSFADTFNRRTSFASSKSPKTSAVSAVNALERSNGSAKKWSAGRRCCRRLLLPNEVVTTSGIENTFTSATGIGVRNRELCIERCGRRGLWRRAGAVMMIAVCGHILVVP